MDRLPLAWQREDLQESAVCHGSRVQAESCEPKDAEEKGWQHSDIL